MGVVLDVDESPGMGEHVTQFFLGRQAADHVGGRGRDPGTAHGPDGQPGRSGRARKARVPIAFVAVDLLALDDEPLLGVPLLERKRLLESVLPESTRVRRTPFVREPAGSFMITWRSAGFGGLAYKEAEQPLPPGRPQRRLVAHRDAAPLRRAAARRPLASAAPSPPVVR